jgi:succinate dehydrogenase / fumarate reductase cytochrome b subunit
MNDSKNPLSPHLQIYRWQISSLVSIFHRITGIINVMGLTIICLWIGLLFFGESRYGLINIFFQSYFGKVFIMGFVWSYSFHLLSGIRHLILDLGYGYEIKTANISGIIVIIGSLVLTVLMWLIGRGLI